MKLYRMTKECMICLCQIVAPMGPQGCQHQFCRGCLETWMENNRTCPVCRLKFTVVQYGYDAETGKFKYSKKAETHREQQARILRGEILSLR